MGLGLLRSLQGIDLPIDFYFLVELFSSGLFRYVFGFLPILGLLLVVPLSFIIPFDEPFCPTDGITAMRPVEPLDFFPYSTCEEFYDGYESSPFIEAAVVDWCRGGSYFEFSSGAQGGNADLFDPIKIWWRCDGDENGGREVLFVHGFPTSSYDTWSDTGKLLLAEGFYVCHVDHAGFGFSDKPRAPYFYSIYEHAAALHKFVTEVAGLTSFHMLTHDMGDSVGLAFLETYVNEDNKPNFSVTHLTITNGNVWLPLSSLSNVQLVLLDNNTGPILERALGPAPFAFLLSRLYEPPLGLSKIASLSSTFRYQDGTLVQNDLNQYLQQRACYETQWIAALNESDVPVTIAWGQKDPVAPKEVGDFLWDEVLSVRKSGAPALYVRVNDGGHFVCHDLPELFACLIRDPTNGDCSYAGGNNYVVDSTF